MWPRTAAAEKTTNLHTRSTTALIWAIVLLHWAIEAMGVQCGTPSASCALLDWGLGHVLINTCFEVVHLPYSLTVPHCCLGHGALSGHVLFRCSNPQSSAMQGLPGTGTRSSQNACARLVWFGYRHLNIAKHMKQDASFSTRAQLWVMEGTHGSFETEEQGELATKLHDHAVTTYKRSLPTSDM
eukprot:1158755-Pelagomonas_calceolata.AAC.2